MQLSIPQPTNPITKPVKVFKNGASQAVRLPAEFRFDAKEIYATLDPCTGNVTLSTKPSQTIWQSFFELNNEPLDEIGQTFMNDRPMNRPIQDKDIF